MTIATKAKILQLKSKGYSMLEIYKLLRDVGEVLPLDEVKQVFLSK